MKILWLVNIVMPELSAHLRRNPSVFGGWLSGAMNAVRESEHDLVICTTEKRPVIQRYDVSSVRYYLVPAGSVYEMEKHFQAVLQQENPDVVHIYGTEFEQSWAMAKNAGIDRTVVTVQGALTYLQDVVYAGLPEELPPCITATANRRNHVSGLYAPHFV